MKLPFRKAETELDREMRHHLESLAESFERQGLSPAEAMQRARREFGGVEQFKERCRDERRWRPLAQLWQDLAFGIRMLRKTPAVTAAAVLSLALGIGATTAILSLVDAVLWRQVGVPQPEQLTEILWQAKDRPGNLHTGASGSMFPEGALRVADYFSYAAYEAMRAGAAGHADLAAHAGAEDVSVSYEGTTAVSRVRPVSGNFFQALALRPQLGRLISPADDSLSAPLAIITTASFWRTMLKADPQIAGQALRMNNRLYTIAGVLPASFGGIAVGDRTDLYTAIPHAPEMLDPESFFRRALGNARLWPFQIIARRRPETSEQSLRAILNAAFVSTWLERPKSPETTPSIRVQNAGAGLGSARRNMGTALSILFALVALVLTIACANIANLLLARADSRRKEVALRISLGCGRARLIRQFFTESVLLAMLGGLLSVAVAYATANFAVPLMPGDMRLQFPLDVRIILATLAVTAGTALMFGLYPAWRASRVDAMPSLKEGAGSIGGTAHSWLAPGKVLVFTQVALGVLLVAAAGTFNAHLRKIVNQDTGFERTRLLMFDLRPGESGYRDDRLRQFYLDLEQRLSAAPGVEAVGMARIRPMLGGGYWDDYKLPGHDKSIQTAVNFVTADYLRALGVRIISGRGISAQDLLTNARVAVVSEDVEKEIGRSPLGLSLELDKKQYQVIGVAAPARYARLTEQPHVLYVPNPLKQDSITVLLRTAAAPMTVLNTARRTVAELDKNLPIVKPVTMEDQIAQTLQRERLFAWLCGAFGVLALVLCMVGLYGVMSYAASRRRQEIGIRMALGASPGNVLRHIAGEGLAVALAGLALGVPVAWYAASKYIDHKRLGMEPLDPVTLAWTCGALAAAAILAVLAPAVRAASADPVKALREN